VHEEIGSFSVQFFEEEPSPGLMPLEALEFPHHPGVQRLVDV
jgi:hypothetical protein